MENAFILPVLLLAVFGCIEMAIVVLIGSSLDHAIIEASRFRITGTGTPVNREERIVEIVRDNTFGLVDMEKVEITTFVYGEFGDIGQSEPLSDGNGNGRFDAGSSFTDVNGNGSWDADMGEAGLGGPDDIVVYQVSYAWGLVTPLINELLGNGVKHVASVVVRNEP